MKNTVLIIGLLFGTFTSYSQYTNSDSTFFESASQDFQTWLDDASISILTTESFEHINGKIQLNLKATSSLDWMALRSSYYMQTQRHIGKEFLHQMRFFFELPLDSVSIGITSILENESFFTHLEYQEGVFEDSDPLPLDVKIKGNGDYPITEMAAFTSIPIILKNKSEKDAAILKEQIINSFKSHYENKEQWFGRQAIVDVLEVEDEFSIEVTNISKEVLYDFTFGYFELILIDVYIQKKGQNIEIVYSCRAKYGSGIFIAPRRSGYTNMKKDYPEYVNRYNKIVRQMILDIITTTPIKN